MRGNGSNWDADRKKRKEKKKREAWERLEVDIREYRVGKLYKAMEMKTLWTGSWPLGERLGVVPVGAPLMFIQDKVLADRKTGKKYQWKKVIVGELIGWWAGAMEELEREEESETKEVRGSRWK